MSGIAVLFANSITAARHADGRGDAAGFYRTPGPAASRIAAVTRRTEVCILADRSGRQFIIDAVDLPLVSTRNWNVDVQKRRVISSGKGSDGRYSTVRLHRFLLDPPAEMCVDHINGDSLDNRRANLRICTKAENTRNQKPRGGSSAFKGVFRRGDKYASHIWLNGRSVCLGAFATEQEAAVAYDAAALEHFGAFARINFPTVHEPRQ